MTPTAARPNAPSGSPAMIFGIPVTPVATTAAFVFGVAATGFGFEAGNLGLLAEEIKNIRDTINPGESIKVTYYQQKNDFGPGLTYEGRNSNYGFGVTSISGIFVLESVWGIP